MEHFGAKKMANVENPDESKQQAEPCKQKKRGRKPKLTEEERKANKIERDRNGRKAKKAKSEALEKENEELKNVVVALKEELSKARDQQKESPYESKQQAEASSNNSEREKRLEEKIEKLEKEKEADLFKISSLNKELSEIKDRADKLVREVSDESKKVKMAGKVLESGMLQLQKNILDSDDQEDCAENCEFNIPMDHNFLNSLDLDMLENFSAWLDPQSSKTKGSSYEEDDWTC